MKIQRSKILIILFSAIIVFFAYTFSKNWGVTLAEKNTTDYQAKVNEIKDNMLAAKRECPSIVKKLEADLPELQKNQRQQKIWLNYKLIADCQLAARNFKQAKQYYWRLIRDFPQDATLYERFAYVNYEDENYGDALRFSHLSIQLNPKQYKSRLLEARVLARLNKTVSAIEAYQEALKVTPYKKKPEVEKELNHLIELNNLQMSGL